MTDEHPMMAGSATVFVVSDITASLAYYRDVLGFEVTFEYGQPPSYACLCRDEVGLHLLAAAATKRMPGHGGICIFVTDVDQVYVELSGRGARLLNRPEDRDYSMRDFDVVDADGNQLTFGMGTDDAA
ncbi:catechol 2,3-dioxygenase-like lactoylglutathione lyase family enzyme [Bradyrhizobium japonicum USDA 38]|uniref:bleomycin resistance protein n=1 Tax=Bradyrhizobium japonicum TaxID=375 RepID=UPI000414740C|nr:VOC family protein [Bradyrhizobium japonicum]MCS3898548.1 catechol 2,3-dioxygenase-like lactoylglutathione lyase family enzyme [Bradyrhizobium japonicum USDA 38]MCS3941601.1 catechol 2,3-dioxygenase-like lactoylglutathione lyase family enzyme [Bradyrhizobium japonicum]